MLQFEYFFHEQRAITQFCQIALITWIVHTHDKSFFEDLAQISAAN